MIDLSRQKELAMGADSYRRLLEGKPVLPDAHPTSNLVRKVGSQIAAAAGLEGTQWEFKVVDSPTVNAACLPGGKVVVFRGLLDLFKNDETALAGAFCAVYGTRCLCSMLNYGVHIENKMSAERMPTLWCSSAAKLRGRNNGTPFLHQRAWNVQLSWRMKQATSWLVTPPSNSAFLISCCGWSLR
jgi:predicted Zn-dependent protease